MSATVHELTRLAKLMEWHLDRFFSPPRGCSSVLLWENMEALSIGRAAAQMRPLLRDVAQMTAQHEIQFHPPSVGALKISA